MKDVVIVGALRTPIGCFRGALAGHSAVELGSLVVKALIERTSVPAYAVDEVILGQVLTAGAGGAGQPYKKILGTDEKFNNIKERENASGGPAEWSARGIFLHECPGQGCGQRLGYHGKFHVIPLILRQAVLQKVHRRSCSGHKAVL